ncbi:MAG: type I phosphomannose isomerase catalytic subunit [Bacteroidales bacterium]
MKSIYPYIFSPIIKSPIWGGSRISNFKNITNDNQHIGESWEISHIPGSESIVCNGPSKGATLSDLIKQYGSDLLGKGVTKKFNDEFPLLIKLIDTSQDLSVQVHPNDQLAKERHNSSGKSEMWYIIESDMDSVIYSGFKNKTSIKEYKQAILDNRVKEILNEHRAKPGEVFYIPAGTVHTIGKGCLLLEIQQNSDITYRIYDYDRRDSNGNLRELHTELAQEAIDFEIDNTISKKQECKSNERSTLLNTPYFAVNKINVDSTVVLTTPNFDSFTIYVCTKGEVTLYADGCEPITITQGNTILVPAIIREVKLECNNSSEVIESYVP